MAQMSRRGLVVGGIAFMGYCQTLRAFGIADQFNHLTDAPDPIIETKVTELLSRMTLNEKVRQLCSLKIGPVTNRFTDPGTYTPEVLRQYFGTAGIGSISLPIADLDATSGTEVTNLIQRIAADETRLGIPPLVDGEGLRGLRANGSCLFPTAIGLSATWDPSLVESAARIVGREAHSRGIRCIFAPVLNLARDPRHGRTEETYGEDPFLTSRLGVAFVNGLQSQGVSATPKHFIANFEGDGGRDSGDVEVSERMLRELYLVPFKAVVEEAGALGIMCAYNSVNGVPCALSRWLLTDVLRGEWKFQGTVVSDWNALPNAIQNLHAVDSPGEVARLALTAGTDVETPRLDVYNGSLADEVTSGRCKLELLDESVRRMLRLKFRLGLFDDRYQDSARAAANADTPRDRQTALLAAQRSIVLLRNDHSVLPLKPLQKTIAVIGPNADQIRLGGYAPEVVHTVSPLQALRQQLGDQVTLHYAKGCDLTGGKTDGFADAISAARDSEVSILYLGGSHETAGEERDRASLDLSGQQEALIDAISGLGKPVVVVLITGGPVTMTRWIDKVDSVLMAWYPGEEGSKAISQILVGNCNPSGHLPVTFPLYTGQIPMPYNHRPYGRAGSTFEIPNVFDSVRYSPLFPFGFGLSYTAFTYSDLTIVPQEVSPDGSIQVSVTVSNTGPYGGEHVVQLYLSLTGCRITQPSQRLCAFQRIALAKGSSKTVTFVLGKSDVSYLNEELKPQMHIGKCSILVGGSSQEGLRSSFDVVEVGYGDPYA